MVMPRARSSGAASISSYFFGALLPMEAKAIVRAAVKVVLPWSTWPMVPMLTWGFLRSNLPRAALTVKEPRRRGNTEVVATVVRKGGRKEEERWVGVSLEGIEEKKAEVVVEE